MRIKPKTSEKLRQCALHMMDIEGDLLEATAAAARMYYSKLLKHHFDDTVRYKPLTPKYAKQKIRKYGRQPILVASGRLRDAVLSTGTVKIYKKSVKLVFDLPNYGEYVLEARDFLMPSETDFSAIINALGGELVKIVERNEALINQNNR